MKARRFVCAIVLVTACSPVFAQEKEKTVVTPSATADVKDPNAPTPLTDSMKDKLKILLKDYNNLQLQAQVLQLTIEKQQRLVQEKLAEVQKDPKYVLDENLNWVKAPEKTK